MNRDEFVNEMAALGHGLRPEPLDISELVALGRQVVAERERPLRNFVASFVERPEWHRCFWLGVGARRRALLEPIERRGLDLLGIDPDLLGPSGDRYDETTHTRTLAWALNHPALREWTRRTFFEAVLHRNRSFHEAPDPNWSSLDLGGLNVRAERVLDGFGRVDVWFESQDHVIAVEAKLLSGEGEDQTGRYWRAREMHGNGRDWSVVFLTLDPDQEAEGPSWHLTFRDLLVEWLPLAAEGRTGAHEHLGRYLASVARIVGVGRPGSFDDWNFIERRQALDLIERVEER